MAALDLLSLPKVDLHVHLEGSMRVATLRELAGRDGVPLPSGLAGDRYVFEDFPGFIRQWVACLQSLRRLEDFRRLAREFCEDEAGQGVRYAEVHFSLPEHAERVGSWEAPLEAVLEGFEEGERTSGIVCRVIVDVVRGLPFDLSERAGRIAERYAGQGVIAVGLGGSETFAPGDYEPIFRRARDAGLHAVPHAGESSGPDSIREAIDRLGAERIAHGIRILEDPDLVEEVRGRGIPLDVCPTSNVMTRVVERIEDHPLPRLRAAGLTVTLASDDPAMFASPLGHEYEVARSVFGMDDPTLADLAVTGVLASFAPQRLQGELVDAIERVRRAPTAGDGPAGRVKRS